MTAPPFARYVQLTQQLRELYAESIAVDEKKAGRRNAEPQKYTSEERRAYVQAWVDSGLSKFEFARKHGIEEGQFTGWTRRYTTVRRDARGASNHSDETKRAVLQAIAAGEGYPSAAKRYGVPANTVWSWVQRERDREVDEAAATQKRRR